MLPLPILTEEEQERACVLFRSSNAIQRKISDFADDMDSKYGFRKQGLSLQLDTGRLVRSP